MENSSSATAEFIKSLMPLRESKLHKYFEPMSHYIKMVVEGYSNALILKSDGGLGKTFGLLKCLVDSGQPFAFLNSYSTPLKFYEFMYYNRNRIIAVDDCEGILTEKSGISIIKSATWSVTPKRVVSYHSSSDKLKVPSNFIYTKGFIFSLNTKLVDNATVNALKSRALYYELKFSYSQKIEIMDEIAKENYKTLTIEERQEVMDYLKNITDETTDDLNFRTLIKAFDIYLYAKKYNVNWKALIEGLITRNEILAIIKKIDDTESDTVSKIAEFNKMTGKSQASYYRAKRKLVKLSKKKK